VAALAGDSVSLEIEAGRATFDASSLLDDVRIETNFTVMFIWSGAAGAVLVEAVDAGGGGEVVKLVGSTVFDTSSLESR
jgi:hypothetical protein